tara:strand:- start:51331 stop:51822 length:492 start_codon:yes stop_codon:yes gene_type:complete
MIVRIIYCFIILVLCSCTASPRYSSSSNAKKQSIKKNVSKFSNNRSLRNKNVKVGDVIRGVSSWYGPNFHGKLTANGEVFDQYGVTAAHKTLPLGTVVRVTNIDNDKSIILRINDRGPYVGNRILDCSYGAATKLGFKDLGTANVEIKIIEIGDGVYMHHNSK